MKNIENNILKEHHVKKMRLSDFASSRFPELTQSITQIKTQTQAMVNLLPLGEGWLAKTASFLTLVGAGAGWGILLASKYGELGDACLKLVRAKKLRLSGRRESDPSSIKKLPVSSIYLSVNWLENTAAIRGNKFTDVRISAEAEKRPIGRPQKADGIQAAILELNRTDPEFKSLGLASKYDYVRKFCGIQKYDPRIHKGYSNSSLYSELKKINLNKHN